MNNTDKERIIETILSIKNDCHYLNSITSETELKHEHKRICSKYDIMILGEGLNTIYSNELASYLNIDNQQMSKLLQPIANELNLVIKPFHTLSTGEFDGYSITLF